MASAFIMLALLLASAAQPAGSPAPHQVQIEAARALAGSGRVDEAISAFEGLARADPADAVVRNALGSLLNRVGRYPEALVHAQAAVALEPGNARFRYNRGIVLAEHGRFEEAVADFDAAISAHPDLTYAYLERGAARLSLGRAVEARLDWETARRADPALIWTQWYRATLAVYEGDYAEAARLFDEVAAAEPAFVPAQVWRSVARGRAGAAVAPAAGPDEWPGPVLAYFRGDIGVDRLLALAARDRTSGDERRTGEALYFIAQAELIAGRRAASVGYFRRAVATDSPRHAWKLSAERELVRLAGP